MPDLSPYSVILFVHVLSAVVLLGSTLSAPLTRSLIRDASSPAELRALLEFERRSTKWNPLAAFVMLGSGVYLGSVGWWTEGWFYVAIAAWIANSVLAVAVVQRTAGSLVQATARSGEGPPTADLMALQRSRAWTLANGAMLANDLTILYVMFGKPGLIASVALVAFANLAALAVSSLRHRAALARRAAVTPSEPALMG